MLVVKAKTNKFPGHITNIEKDTIKNNYYRKVLFTTKNCQLVLMSIPPKEEIGEEVHELDQFIRFEAGEGQISMDGMTRQVSNGFSIVVPEGVSHNVINISETEDLKLYAIYTPPQHKKDTIHKTKKEEKEEHFDGKTDL